MTRAAATDLAPTWACHVFDAAAMSVVAGANTGDPLAPPDEVCLGDVYELAEDARALRLSVCQAGTGQQGGFLAGRGQLPAAFVAEGTEAGRPGDALRPEGRLTFMAPDGERAEVLLLSAGEDRRLFLPLSPLEPGLDYTLIAAVRDPGPVTLADVTSVAFTRGTLITLPDGSQRPIEELRPGDLVLTRDHGAQPVRHAIARTLRAVGPFAPVVIPRETLRNANDLVLSQHQRLLLYQRGARRLVATAEMWVRARDLVDGETVTIRKGGFCDYVSLAFDRHEVIYAECIPAESLLVNDETRRSLPEDARRALDQRLGPVSQTPAFGTEAPAALLAQARARLLRRPRHDLGR
jgi:hypothetical protein